MWAWYEGRERLGSSVRCTAREMGVRGRGGEEGCECWTRVPRSTVASLSRVASATRVTSATKVASATSVALPTGVASPTLVS